MRIDDLALLVYSSRCGTRFTCRIEVLLSTKLFTRELSGRFNVRSVRVDVALQLHLPDAEAMVVMNEELRLGALVGHTNDKYNQTILKTYTCLPKSIAR